MQTKSARTNKFVQVQPCSTMAGLGARANGGPPSDPAASDAEFAELLGGLVDKQLGPNSYSYRQRLARLFPSRRWFYEAQSRAYFTLDVASSGTGASLPPLRVPAETVERLHRVLGLAADDAKQPAEHPLRPVIAPEQWVADRANGLLQFVDVPPNKTYVLSRAQFDVVYPGHRKATRQARRLASARPATPRAPRLPRPAASSAMGSRPPPARAEAKAAAAPQAPSRPTPRAPANPPAPSRASGQRASASSSGGPAQQPIPQSRAPHLPPPAREAKTKRPAPSPGQPGQHEEPLAKRHVRLPACSVSSFVLLLLLAVNCNLFVSDLRLWL